MSHRLRSRLPPRHWSTPAGALPGDVCLYDHHRQDTPARPVLRRRRGARRRRPPPAVEPLDGLRNPFSGTGTLFRGAGLHRSGARRFPQGPLPPAPPRSAALLAAGTKGTADLERPARLGCRAAPPGVIPGAIGAPADECVPGRGACRRIWSPVRRPTTRCLCARRLLLRCGSRRLVYRRRLAADQLSPPMRTPHSHVSRVRGRPRLGARRPGDAEQHLHRSISSSLAVAGNGPSAAVAAPTAADAMRIAYAVATATAQFQQRNASRRAPSPSGAPGTIAFRAGFQCARDGARRAPAPMTSHSTSCSAASRRPCLCT